MMGLDQQQAAAREFRLSSKTAWHMFALRPLFEALDSAEEGLSSETASSRLSEFGLNELPHRPPTAWWEVLLNQFRSPLIYILAAAAVVSLGLGDVTDAGFILGVLLLNALIGGYQEWRAEQSSRALQKLLHIRAAVMRDGEVCEIDAEEVVPGDVVWLEAGNRVPADVRLLMANGLEIDESLLTGESVAVLKDPAWTGQTDTPVADRLNMTYAGSIVARGRGKGVVVATGATTVVGQLALDVLEEGGGRPPLLERLERFSRVIAYSVLIAAVVVGLLGVVMRGYSVTEMFIFAVALAVAAIPEGLPVAMTVALAVATTRMARRGVIVRRLAAVEGLGSCTMIASDKTGTLTCNELTVREIHLANGEAFEVTGEGFVPEGEVRSRNERASVAVEEHPLLDSLVRAAVLCNEGDLHRRDGDWIWHGDPTDVALLAMGRKLGLSREATLDDFAQINEIPFEPERQFAATFHERNGTTRVFVKGAPERVLTMCADGEREEFRKLAESLAEGGYRVLAVAEGELAQTVGPTQTPDEPDNLTFLGLVGMIDPLRSGAREAVASCHAAGVTVCMVTGDHPATALAIARDLGFATTSDQVVTGADLVGRSRDYLENIISEVRVFARVAPRQKLEIVEAAIISGHFVAVTGDGVNDAPALRAANIGVAMGKSGTDVAREAAELVISDDNFATIVAGVEEGRIAYDNIRKVIYLLVSTGAAEVMMIGMTIVSNLPLPLLPVQLLWLNLVTNGIQDVALAFEPGEGDVLSRKPRPPRERIFNRLMIERTINSGCRY
ncbi:MAG TPA: HAD-IC family P-type ATPase [Pyrinomonadaceae bacterium]|nr:HAD-IC family P-type ATPase [Pyrinomonadaceae bacterium]